MLKKFLLQWMKYLLNMGLGTINQWLISNAKLFYTLYVKQLEGSIFPSPLKRRKEWK